MKKRYSEREEKGQNSLQPKVSCISGKFRLSNYLLYIMECISVTESVSLSSIPMYRTNYYYSELLKRIEVVKYFIYFMQSNYFIICYDLPL